MATSVNTNQVLAPDGLVHDGSKVFGVGTYTFTQPLTLQTTSGTDYGTGGWTNTNRVISGVRGVDRGESVVVFQGPWSANHLIATPNSGATQIYTASVRDIGIRGPHDLGQHPYSNPDSLPSLGTAIYLNGNHRIVDNIELFNWQGLGVYMSASDQIYYHSRLSNSTIRGCQSGTLLTSDQMVHNNVIGGVRDYCIVSDIFTGNAQTSCNHCFACTTAFNLNGGFVQSTHDVASDCDEYGVNCLAGTHRFYGLVSQHNILGNILTSTTSAENSFIECVLNVARSYDGQPDVIWGAALGGRGNRLTGRINLSNYNFPWGQAHTVRDGGTGIVLYGFPNDNDIDVVISGLSFNGGFDLGEVALDVRDPMQGNRIKINTGVSFFVSGLQRLITFGAGVAVNSNQNIIEIRGAGLGPAVATPTSWVTGISGLPANNVVVLIDTDSNNAVRWNQGAGTWSPWNGYTFA